MKGVEGGMREPKPYWREVPMELRKQIEDIMDGSIRMGTRIFGGYGPSATFRIFLRDGRTLFAKGAGPGSSPVNWRVLPLEEAVYRELDAIRAISPSYLGSVSVEGWHLLLMEDLKDARKVPPWTEKLALSSMRDLADFHVRGRAEDGKVKELEGIGLADNWASLKSDKNARNGFLDLYTDRRGLAEAWLEEAEDVLIAAERDLLRRDQPWGVIHADIRSDNLRFRSGRLVLFDWALACRGPLLLDPVFFFPSLEGEGGPSAERLLTEYLRAMACQGIEFPAFALPSAAAAVSGFFALRAGQPPIPGLPRLREVQRLQLAPALRWSARSLGLPLPPTLSF